MDLDGRKRFKLVMSQNLKEVKFSTCYLPQSNPKRIDPQQALISVK